MDDSIKELELIRIRSLLNKGSSIGREIQVFDSVDSTNTLGKELGKQKNSHGMVIIAKEQKAGRGRLGREWSSKKGDGIYMSVILKPNIVPSKAPFLTLITALAVNRSIKEVTGLESKIKWPNDIVINGKKVCGILTEMSTINTSLDYVVIGIGVNVNGVGLPPSLSSMASSLRIESNKVIDPNVLVTSILENLEEYYIKETLNTEFPFVKEYNEELINRNKIVRIIDNNTEFTGEALGIDENGALLVKRHGFLDITKIVSGEVSVRGVYGYV